MKRRFSGWKLTKFLTKNGTFLFRIVERGALRKLERNLERKSRVGLISGVSFEPIRGILCQFRSQGSPLREDTVSQLFAERKRPPWSKRIPLDLWGVMRSREGSNSGPGWREPFSFLLPRILPSSKNQRAKKCLKMQKFPHFCRKSRKSLSFRIP